MECKHTGCPNRVVSKGYCQNHYNQMRKYGETYDHIGYGKQNARCKTRGCSAHAIDFCPAHALTGRGQCGAPGCPEPRRSTRNQFCDKHAREDRRLRHFYGISVIEYEQTKLDQGGLCAICNKSRPLHLDHCHDSGTIRGFLCGSCNRGIGLFAHDSEVLRRAAAYLD